MLIGYTRFSQVTHLSAQIRVVGSEFSDFVWNLTAHFMYFGVQTLRVRTHITKLHEVICVRPFGMSHYTLHIYLEGKRETEMRLDTCVCE